MEKTPDKDKTPNKSPVVFTCPRRSESTFFNDEKNVDSWADDQTCSYCGSLSPDALFMAIDNNEEICPTDKNYKIYVSDTKKFYFQHLSKEEKYRFVNCLNTRKIKLAYPGHFYVLPFFITQSEIAEPKK